MGKGSSTGRGRVIFTSPINKYRKKEKQYIKTFLIESTKKNHQNL